MELVDTVKQTAVDDKMRDLEEQVPGPTSKEDNDQFEQELAELARFTKVRITVIQNGGLPWPNVQLSRIRRFLNWLGQGGGPAVYRRD